MVELQRIEPKNPQCVAKPLAEALQRIVEDFPLWQQESVENGEIAPLCGLYREFFPTNA
jgi:hypothetical protein